MKLFKDELINYIASGVLVLDRIGDISYEELAKIDNAIDAMIKTLEDGGIELIDGEAPDSDDEELIFTE